MAVIGRGLMGGAHIEALRRPGIDVTGCPLHHFHPRNRCGPLVRVAMGVSHWRLRKSSKSSARL
jgi:hypothetical protein